MRPILDVMLGGSAGFVMAFLCMVAQLETKHFPLLATIISGGGALSGACVGAMNRHFSRRENMKSKYLPVKNLNSAIDRISDRYAQLPGNQDVLIALGQVKEEVWLPPR